MKLLIPILFVIIGLTCNETPSNNFLITKNNSQTDKIKGLNFVAPPDPYSNNPMDAVRELGANWIAVIPYGFTRIDQPKVGYNSGWQWWGERPEGIKKTIELAKASDVKVILKPQIYIHRGWTGDIDFESEKEWQSWEKSYEEFLIPFAKMADSLDVELFCVGTEFKKSVKKREQFWRSLIEKVRKVYKGKLTYAANWDEYLDVPFWDALDYAGVNAYFPLTNSKTPKISELKKAWQPYLKEIRRFYKKVNKPMIFTEYGYLSVDGCAHNTWELEAKVKELKINQKAQANALHALFETFWEEPYWNGGFLWKWFPEMRGGEGYNERDYTPQGKTGQEILQNWFLRK
jgi:Glycoside Hydrolase Family 113